MLHLIFVVAHAVFATAALGVGLAALRRRDMTGVYVGLLAGAVAFVAASVAVTWSTLSGDVRALYVLLVALGVYTVFRGGRAVREADTPRWLKGGPVFARFMRGPGRLRDLGFTLITLVEAFVIVLMIDLGAPAWAIAVLAVAIAATGHVAVVRAESHVPRGLERDTAVQSR